MWSFFVHPESTTKMVHSTTGTSLLLRGVGVDRKQQNYISKDSSCIKESNHGSYISIQLTLKKLLYSQHLNCMFLLVNMKNSSCNLDFHDQHQKLVLNKSYNIILDRLGISALTINENNFTTIISITTFPRNLKIVMITVLHAEVERGCE